MRIKNKNSQKKITLITIIAIVFIAVGIGVYCYFNNRASGTHTDSKSSQPSTNLNPATTEEKDAGNQTKSSAVHTNDTSSNSSKDTEPSTPISNSSNVSVQTTASAQNGTTYQLRYLINAVANDAICTLTLTNGSNTVTKTAKTQALAQSSTCQGFDIATSELSPGSWQATMTVSGGNITGSTTSTIKVQ